MGVRNAYHSAAAAVFFFLSEIDSEDLRFPALGLLQLENLIYSQTAQITFSHLWKISEHRDYEVCSMIKFYTIFFNFYELLFFLNFNR